MKKLLALMLAAALALSLVACGGGSGTGKNSATLKEEDAIEATPNEVYTDVKDNEARALQNVYKVTGEIDEIKSDYCRIGSLRIYFSSDILATLSIGETITFLGPISSVETESEGIGMGIISMTHILFSNAVLLETTPQQAGDSKE